MAMCWFCNPFCGKCTPPRMISIDCPDCGKINVFDLQLTNEPEARACEKCGRDLTWDTVPKAKYCLRYEIDCGNPCAQVDQPATEGEEVGTCVLRIEPLGKEI